MRTRQRTMTMARRVLVGVVIAVMTGLVPQTAANAAYATNGVKSTSSRAVSPLARLSPSAFAERLKSPAFVVNVHVPYAGEIAGTDAFIAFDAIVTNKRLPNKQAPILLYCRSGRMSKIAGEALTRAGYTNVADLLGGMDAWAKSGRKVLQYPSRGSSVP